MTTVKLLPLDSFNRTTISEGHPTDWGLRPIKRAAKWYG
jgi:hypothetical protein